MLCSVNRGQICCVPGVLLTECSSEIGLSTPEPTGLEVELGSELACRRAVRTYVLVQSKYFALRTIVYWE